LVLHPLWLCLFIGSLILLFSSTFSLGLGFRCFLFLFLHFQRRDLLIRRIRSRTIDHGTLPICSITRCSFISTFASFSISRISITFVFTLFRDSSNSAIHRVFKELVLTCLNRYLLPTIQSCPTPGTVTSPCSPTRSTPLTCL